MSNELDPDAEVIAIPAEDLSDDTAQTTGLPRTSGVSAETCGAKNLWFGQPTGPPGMDSDPHHHGEAETGGYILSGHCRIYYGADYDKTVDLGPGDFVYVPPYLPHVERNLSDTEPVEFLTTRTPGNIVINLDDDPDIPPR